jgi:amino acid adenylation domain-containing protein
VSEHLGALLERAAVVEPAQPAVVDGGRTLTYEQLERAANRLARLLRELGVERGDRVGVYLDKSAQAVIALYGCLQAGAAYVPLDRDSPPERLAMIAGDAGLRHLVTAGEASEGAAALAAAAGAAAVVSLDCDPVAPPGLVTAGPEALAAQDDSACGVEGRSSDLAYLLYTSGSTGRPKGVALSHGNALAFVEWAVAEFGVSRGDRLASHAPFHFDLSVFDLYAAASAGATLVLVSREESVFPYTLARLIGDREISVWYSAPSALVRLVATGALEQVELPRLRLVLFAGEVFPLPRLRELRRLLPRVRLANLYGPTETNVCTWYELPDALAPELSMLPIGRPIEGVDAFVVADAGGLAPPGEAGELYVAGPTVMQGYWGDPERTRLALVPDPRGGGLAYRTGDLVRLRPDGELDFLGRRDSQVKTRGFRVELGEIEAVLAQHPEVEECAVVAVPDEETTTRLRAFVTVAGGVSVHELVRFCRAKLPFYMVPELVLSGPLPRTSTGKVDRQTLLRAALPAGAAR